MRIRARFLVGAGLIVAAVAYLIFAAIQNTSEYFMTVNEVSAHESALAGQSLRIAGRVKPGTIEWDPATLTLKFAMVQIPDPAQEGVKPVAASDPQSFRVICVGQAKPDMFAPNRDVIVEGKLAAGGVINASQVMTSCPSKYRPKQGK
jgi:cytochrome c-type biogenesis protein CcmE